MSAVPVSKPAGLGFRAVRGGSVVVGVSLGKDGPRLALSAFLATAADGDRLSLEPFHVAAETVRTPDGRAAAEAAVAEGRRRQEALALAGLHALVARLRDEDAAPIVAALLVNRAGWVADLLDYSLAFAEHAAVAEGLAVREALRFAFAQAELASVEIDEKSLPETASETLGLDLARIDAQLKALGTIAGRPWRKEQKLACLAAWTALVRQLGVATPGFAREA